MKMDEVELRKVSEFTHEAESAISIRQIAHKERAIVRELGFRLLPDTLFFWADLLMDSWDEYSVQQLYPRDHRLFKRADTARHVNN